MSNNTAALVDRLQNQILNLAAKSKRPTTDATKAAFRAVPRHAFVKRFRSGDEIITVTPANLDQLLPTIYHNGVLSLWTDAPKGIYSTISQPTLVLAMLTLLDLAEGQNVFELGAGSGWNAAMMGHIVGAKGRVVSVEIIPEVAEAARQAVAERDIRNVEILTGDAGAGFAAGGPYDRAIFTAGSYDLPRAFHDQLRVGSLLLMVLKIEGGSDQLFLLEKKPGCFESKFCSPCGFVPMTGKHAFAQARPVLLNTLPQWTELSQKEVDRRSFWWGTEGEAFSMAATGVRSFLGIAEPFFRVFRDDVATTDDARHWFCGLFDPDAKSLAVARNGELVSYGNLAARDRLIGRLHEWIDLGMPSVSALHLRIFPIESEILPDKSEWVVRRNESAFVWSLKGPGKLHP